MSHGASVYKPYVLRVTRFEGDGVQEQGMVFKSRRMVFKSRGMARGMTAAPAEVITSIRGWLVA